MAPLKRLINARWWAMSRILISPHMSGVGLANITSMPELVRMKGAVKTPPVQFE